MVITRSLQMIRMLDNKVLGFTVIGFRLTLNRSLQRMRMLDNEVALRSHPLANDIGEESPRRVQPNDLVPPV